jgi:hypothetical protein
MDILALALFFGLVGMFVIRAWKAHGRLSAGDRWSLITSVAMALTSFAIAPLLINWVVVPAVVWLPAVALLSGGVVGAVLRWPDLAWSMSMHPIRHAISVGATLASCLLITRAAIT